MNLVGRGATMHDGAPPEKPDLAASVTASFARLGRKHYTWPFVDGALDGALARQARRSLPDQTAVGVIGEFERAFAAFLGAEHVLAFSSGTAAIHAMVAATGMQPGDEVLVGAYGFFASASPLAYEGLRIRFVDVDRFGNIDADAAEAAISERTRAIMCVHMWGNPCDMPAFRELCDRKGLWLLEDCAHAHFARSRGVRVGTTSDMASFSFNQKALTAGEGGALVCRTRSLYESAILFGHYNKRAISEVTPTHPDRRFAQTGYGLKYRPHTLAMAIGLDQLDKAADIEARRRRNLERLRSALSDHPHLELLASSDRGDEPGLYVAPLVVMNVDQPSEYRERLCRWIESVGGSEIDIPGSTGLMTGLPLFGDNAETARSGPDTSRAADFADRILKLPLWGYPGDEEIVDAYGSALAASANFVSVGP